LLHGKKTIKDEWDNIEVLNYSLKGQETMCTGRVMITGQKLLLIEENSEGKCWGGIYCHSHE